MPRQRADIVQDWGVHPPPLPSDSDEEEPLPEKTYLQTTIYRLRTERAKGWVQGRPHPLAWRNWSPGFWVHTLGMAVTSTLDANLGLNLLHPASALMLRRLDFCFFNAGEVEMHKGSWGRWARTPTGVADLLASGFAPADDDLRDLCERQQGYVLLKRMQLICKGSSEIMANSGIMADRPHLNPHSLIKPSSISFTTEDNKHVVRCSIKSVSRKKVVEACLTIVRQFAAVEPDATNPPESGEPYAAAALANMLAQLVQRQELTEQQQKGIVFGYEGLRRRAPLYTCIGTKLLQEGRKD